MVVEIYFLKDDLGSFYVRASDESIIIHKSFDDYYPDFKQRYDAKQKLWKYSKVDLNKFLSKINCDFILRNVDEIDPLLSAQCNSKYFKIIPNFNFEEEDVKMLPSYFIKSTQFEAIVKAFPRLYNISDNAWLLPIEYLGYFINKIQKEDYSIDIKTDTSLITTKISLKTPPRVQQQLTKLPGTSLQLNTRPTVQQQSSTSNQLNNNQIQFKSSKFY
jgi:hypothetical protein